MQRSTGRHQTGLTGVFSNLSIVSEGLFFGLLSHYTVMVAIFCLGIWHFLGGVEKTEGGWFEGGQEGVHARMFLNQAFIIGNLYFTKKNPC